MPVGIMHSKYMKHMTKSTGCIQEEAIDKQGKVGFH